MKPEERFAKMADHYRQMEELWHNATIDEKRDLLLVASLKTTER